MQITDLDDGWITGQFEAFDTVNQIMVPDENADILDECHSLCVRLHDLFSPATPTSDVSRINRGKGSVVVQPETARLVREALDYGVGTGGLFDITVAAAVKVWDFKNRRDALPDWGELAEAAGRRGLDEITVDGCTIDLPERVSVDFGGIAKGYIADRLTQLLRGANVRRAMVNLGGNVALVGGFSRDEDWRVGIRQPDGGRWQHFAVFHGRDCSVVTSAASERYVELDGIRYHHLLNPESGWPADSDLVSATVISPSSTCADVLSTACFVGGMKRAVALLESFEDSGAQGVLLDKWGRVYLSRALRGGGSVELRGL